MDPSPGTPLGTSSTVPFVVGFGISANNGAEHTPRELRGSVPRPFLGPRNSSLEPLQHFCMLG
eukprot:15456306-Alexandrium_andersonii.AAC.1